MGKSGGKVEIISKLVRWRVGRFDTMGPWLSYGEWSYCLSDRFKMGIWQWKLGILNKNETGKNNQVKVGLLRMESSSSSFPKEEKPPTARYVFRVLDTHPGSSPHISPILEKEFPNGILLASEPVNYNSHLGSFILLLEFLELRPLDVGMVQSLATKSTHPCLSRMLKERIHADVTINTGDGGVLKAHKAVLSASSPIFESMFFHDLKENATSTIDIEDMSSESCMALLCYMYGTLRQEEFWEKRLSLVVTADKYGMTDLKDYCEESLLEDLCSSNVLERLQKASLHQLDKLKKGCMSYLFDFGMVYEVRDEIDSFFRVADQELKSEIFLKIMNFWKPV